MRGLLTTELAFLVRRSLSACTNSYCEYLGGGLRLPGTAKRRRLALSRRPSGECRPGSKIVKRHLSWFLPLLIAMPFQSHSADRESGAQITLAQSEPSDAGSKPDRSLIPGLQADLKAALDDAASARDSAAAAKKELDQRMSESNHWKDEIASVDKDRDTYNKQVVEFDKDSEQYSAQVLPHNAKCAHHDKQLSGICDAEQVQLQQWYENRVAEKGRLNQAKADLETRYTNINNMIENLNERITTLSRDQINAMFAYNRAIKRVDDLHKQLQQN